MARENIMFRSHIAAAVSRALLASGLLTAALLLPPSTLAQSSGTLKLDRPSSTVLQRMPPVTFVAGVSALSPVQARIDWTDASEAPGYDILRNGVAIHAVGSAERLYVDTSLRPNTRYSYQVRARTSPPTNTSSVLRTGVVPPGGPVRGPIGGAPVGQPIEPTAPAFTPISSEPAGSTRITAAVDFVTPRALAPSGFSVSMRPDGSTRIAWTPRAESREYIVTRDGAPISIPNGPPVIVTSATASSGSYDDRMPAGTYTYSVQSLLRTSDGANVLGEPSPLLTIVTRSFNIVAVGDSVMWGQGLADNSKFVTQVRQRLQGALGKNVRLFLFARSGAEFGEKPYPAQFPLNDENQAVQELAASYGEIPRTLPSILHQALTVAPGQVAPDDVDLVLMDGCINDVGLMKILDPTMSEAAISARTQHLCGPDTMNERLARVHGTFRNAKILLTGYFPIVSNQSDMTAVVALMTNLGALSAAAAPLLGLPVDPVTGAIVGLAASQALRQSAISHSTVFFTTSSSALMTAAVGSNQALSGNRIRFVPIPFAPQNAYAAPDTWLWLVPTPGVPISNAEDEVFQQRLRACQSVPNMPATCIPASMGHPNVKGAQAYADAIMNALAEFTPPWKAQHALTKVL